MLIPQNKLKLSVSDPEHYSRYCRYCFVVFLASFCSALLTLTKKNQHFWREKNQHYWKLVLSPLQMGQNYYLARSTGHKC